MIAIVNYGVGNLKSIQKALEYVGGKVIVTADAKTISEASGVIFPGVGAFRTAISKLNEMREVIDDLSVSVLGICLGMQLLASESYEGGRFEGLNRVPGRVVRFPSEVGKVPHMGWNNVEIIRDHEIFDGIENGSFFYFVHSYYLETDRRYVVGETEYGLRFASAIAERNYIGVQFHPEKSGKVGLRLLENFLKLCRS
ncbi:MAG: imidazole glycerol phosphate synthase subunit HisH [Candidatus Methanosuratincola petrocarbonis]